jgi:hypothetical protein
VKVPAQPKESNEYTVTSRRKRSLKADGFMGLLYMKFQDGKGEGKAECRIQNAEHKIKSKAN